MLHGKDDRVSAINLSTADQIHRPPSGPSHLSKIYLELNDRKSRSIHLLTKHLAVLCALDIFAGSFALFFKTMKPSGASHLGLLVDRTSSHNPLQNTWEWSSSGTGVSQLSAEIMEKLKSVSESRSFYEMLLVLFLSVNIIILPIVSHILLNASSSW